jgi:hypothetical protein
MRIPHKCDWSLHMNDERWRRRGLYLRSPGRGDTQQTGRCLKAILIEQAGHRD